ncbi:Uncharacterized protein SCF082_LOCUS42618, partial [Durusdinium trenchii]
LLTNDPCGSAAFAACYMAQIWRAGFVVDGQEVELVIVDADKLEQTKASQLPSLAQQVLEMPNCYECEKEWPFEHVLGLGNLLKEVGEGWSPGLATYLTWSSPAGELHALGLGSNKKRRKIAALLALTLCRLCGSHWPAPPELRDELYQATAATVLRPPLRPGVAVSASIPVAGQQEHDWPDWQDWRRSRREDWLPLSGSWVWWSSDILVVLCEDVSAQIFADARTWFYEVAEVQQEPEEQRAPRELNQRTQQIFPDIFFTSLFRHQTHAVVGVGRDLEHRKRAGCLGLAARISRGSLCLTRVQGQVVDEVFQSPWLPQEPIQRFFDLENHGFWQNIEIWQESEEHKVAPLTKKNLSDIRMNCQPALLRTLEDKGNMEIDLTHSRRPWLGILKAHQELKWITGSDINRFIVAVDREKLDPYQEVPMIYFEVRTADGHRHRFRDLDRTEETMFRQPEKKDITLAFRLAGGWEVQGRWTAFEVNVFQNLIENFREKERPDGWHEDDFLMPLPTKSSIFAWKLSEELRKQFNTWLQSRTRCQAVDQVRARTLDVDLKATFEDTMEGFLREFEVSDETFCSSDDFYHETSSAWAPETRRSGESGRRGGTFTQKQKLMLDIALAEGVRSSLLKPLDPSRCPDVERNFFCDWCHASEDIRFSHVDVSSEFLHGDGHRGTRLQTLVRELVEGTTDSAQIPALVAVRVQGIRHVVCGNRRLKCYKMAWQRGADCWFKMIVHEFPRCP